MLGWLSATLISLEFLGGPLKTDLRAEGNFPVVPGSIYENDFIAHFQPQSDGAQEGFDSAARIKSRVHIARAKIRYAACKSIERGRRGIEAKIRESALHRYKYADRSGGLKFWSEQAMKHSKVGIRRGNRAGRIICKALGENMVEIVRHFRFDLNIAGHIESGSAAKSHEI